MKTKRYQLLTVSNPSYFSHRDVIRIGAEAGWGIIRRSGKVRLYEYAPFKNPGNPFSRDLSEENQDRLEELRQSVYGGEDW